MKKITLTFLQSIAMLLLFTSQFFLSSCGSSEANISPINSNVGKGGSLARFAIVGQEMYFVDNSKILTYDISNSKNPVLISTTNISTNFVETIFNYGDYLYLGTSIGMYIYSIESPYSPKYMSMATHVFGCDPVVSDGKYTYVTVKNSVSCNRLNTINILEIYNVEDPRRPQFVSSTTMEEPVGLAIDEDVLFVCDKGLKVFDVTDRSRPTLLKTIVSDAYDIIINGDVVLTVDTNGINQYLYDRATLTLTQTSRILTN